MAISLKHAFSSAKSDGADATLVQPSNWNAEHNLTMATGRLLGRTTASAGAAEEISAGTGLTLASGSLSVTANTYAAQGANTDITSVYLNNTGLKIKDTNASHGLIIAPGSDITADRTLTLTTGDAARTLTISGNATVSQDYSTTGNPQFATIELGAATDTTISRVSAGVVAVEGKNVALNGTGETLTTGTIELGAATDTTIARVSAGLISVEGKNVALEGNAVSFSTVTGTTAAILGSGDGTGTVAGGTLRAPAKTGTNVAGVDLTIAGGNGTGTGGGGVIAFQTAPAGSTGTTANTLTERMRVDNAGNVGIGTTSPGKKLDVSGVVRSSGSFTPSTTDWANAAFTGSGSWGGALALVDGTAGYAIYASTTGTLLHFAQGNTSGGTTERLRFEAAGTLLSQPTYDNTATGSTVVVTSSGQIRRTSSSLKYKKDVEDLDDALADNAVANLRPVWYRTKDPVGDDKAEWSHIGLIAEQVDQVEPRLVRYRTTTVEFVDTPVLDDNGNPVLHENGEPQTTKERVETTLESPEPEDVDYGRLSVLLLDVVQRQKIVIANLETRIAALEARV